IVNLLGVTPPADLDGVSLWQSAAHSIYFEALDANLTRDWAPLTGLARGDWKYIDLPDAELYDLRADPGETRNLASREAERRDTMARALGHIVASSPRADSAVAASPSAAGIDAEAAAR